MQVKIVTAGNKSHIMSYNLDKDREVTWIGANQESQIFYGASGNSCFVQDEEFGIIDLHTKEQPLEYHALDKNKDCMEMDKVDFGVQWGHRMARLENKEILIFANNILLPFSYLNIIQRYRSIS